MNFRFLTALLLFQAFIFSNLFGQNKTRLFGRLVDIEKKPIAFVNLVLKQVGDEKVLKLAISRENGNFEFPGLEPGQFMIEGSMVGYLRFKSPNLAINGQEEMNAGEFMMAPSDVKLKEVNVVGTKPFITVEPDKMVMKVDNNPLMMNSNALEVLRKSPGVMVNQDDQIFLQGKNGLLIYIDGRQSPLSEKDLANWLRSMPSSQIDVIEIITNPSAKYDAAGNAGIINIRLKKNSKKGMNGSLNSGISTGLANEHNYTRTNHALSLNYGGGKVNFFGNYGYDYAKSWSFMDIYRKQGEQIFNQQTNTFDKKDAHNFKIGVDFNLGKRHTIGLMTDGNITLNRNNAFSGNSISNFGSTTPYTFLEAKNFGKKTNQTGNQNFNHQYKDTSGREITTDINFGWYNLANETNQPNFYRDANTATDTSIRDRSFGLSTPVNITIFTAKTDYEQKIKKSVVSFGYKISNVLTDNTFSLFNRRNGLNEKDLEQSSSFSYLERVIAGYGSFRQTLGQKWILQAGIRYEQTHSEGNLTYESQKKDSLVRRDYGNFFPSGGITYNLNKQNTLSFNYSRRVDRPVYRFLNPFQYKLDELSYEQGNPFLNPQFTHNFQLSHSFMSMVTTSVGYSHTSDFFARLIDSSGSRTFLTRRNLADVRTLSFNISSPIPIRNWWNGYLNFTFNHQTYEADFGQGKILRLPVDFFSLFVSQSFTLPKDVSIQFSGSYNSPSVWGGTFRNRAFWFLEGGFTKKVLKKKGMVSVSVTDLFLSQRWKGNSNFAGVNMTVWGGNDSRLVKVGFTWNFGQNDFKPSKRKTGNQEERQRLRGE
jgi:hypothetical protein